MDAGRRRRRGTPRSQEWVLFGQVEWRSDGDSDPAVLKETFRAQAGEAGFELTGISHPRHWSDQPDASILYANCRTHKACKYRFRAGFDKSRSQCTVSGHGEHSEAQAVCRQDAKLPTTRAMQSVVQEVLDTSRSRRMTATEVAERVIGDFPSEEKPVGKSIQNMVKKARFRQRRKAPLKLAGKWLRGRAAVNEEKAPVPDAPCEGLKKWCAMRKLDLDSDASQDTVDPTALSVVHSSPSQHLLKFVCPFLILLAAMHLKSRG